MRDFLLGMFVSFQIIFVGALFILPFVAGLCEWPGYGWYGLAWVLDTMICTGQWFMSNSNW